jgi:hypothetical protein
MNYAQAIYRTAARNGWTIEREPGALLVRDQEGRWVRHRLGGWAEEAYNERLERERATAEKTTARTSPRPTSSARADDAAGRVTHQEDPR